MDMKSEGITKVITIHPEGSMNVKTKFNGNSCRDKKSGEHQSQ